METLNTLLQITIYSGIIFFVTMIIKKAFKNKMSPFLHFAIWTIFLLRLIIPVTIDAPLSIFTYQVEPADVPTQTRVAAATSPGNSIETEHTQKTELSHTVTSPEKSHDTIQASSPISTPAVRSATVTPVQIMLIVWLGGAALGLLYFVLIASRLTRRIARCHKPASSHLQRLLKDIKTELNIKTELKLVCQFEYGSPALLFPRTIIFPIDKLTAMDDEQIQNCLRHECMHYKRGDHLMSLLLTVLNAVYWFNPFMWLAYFQMRKDMETACDGAVVKRLKPSARRGYAELILKLSIQSPHMKLALGMAYNQKNIERRIKGVFMTQKTQRSVKLISSMMAILLLLCCFTTACQPTPVMSIVVSNAGSISTEMIAESLPPGTVKKLDAPQHWWESMTRLNGHMVINADTDVKIPEHLADTPVYKIEQIPLTPERLKQLTNYFVGHSKLYKRFP